MTWGKCLALSVPQLPYAQNGEKIVLIRRVVGKTSKSVQVRYREQCPALSDSLVKLVIAVTNIIFLSREPLNPFHCLLRAPG